MLAKRSITIVIGLTEIIIGLTTLIVCTIAQATGHAKPVNLYIFVICTAVAALILGAGLLFRKRWARYLLIFFAGYIILTKILIYTGLMSFPGAIFAVIPIPLKDMISAIYHISLVVLLSPR